MSFLQYGTVVWGGYSVCLCVCAQTICVRFWVTQHVLGSSLWNKSPGCNIVTWGWAMFFSFCLWKVNQKFQLKSKVNTCHIFACGWNICSFYMSYNSYYYVSEHLPIKWEDQRRPENHLWHLPADLYCLMEELWVNCLGMAAAVAPSPDTDSMAAWHGTTNILWRRLVLFENVRWSMVWYGMVWFGRTCYSWI